MFLGSHGIKGNRLGYIIFLFWQDKIYRFNYREDFFFSSGTKLKEGFITWAPLNIILKLWTVFQYHFMVNSENVMQMNGFYATTLTALHRHSLALSLKV